MPGRRPYDRPQRAQEPRASAVRGLLPAPQRTLDLLGGPVIESLDVEVEEVLFEAADRSFAVVRAVPLEGAGGERLRAAGQLGGIARGECARLRGRYVQHPRHGLQYEVESWEPIEPRTAAGIERYLGSGLITGVGKRVAAALVAKFGADTLAVICERPHMLRQVRGVGRKLAHRIHKAVSAHRAEAETLAFLRSYGMGAALARRVLELYGDEARALISANPYRMAEEVKGVGFQTADRIARELGLDLDAPARAAAATLHLLTLARDEGHAGLPREELLDRARALEVGRPAIETAIADLSNRMEIREDLGLVYLRGLHACEAVLAADLAHLAAAGAASRAERHRALVARACASLAPEQVAAVEATLDRRLVVITGGPGTGKTTTLRAVVALGEALGRNVALAAPTGRAARRLAEVTGRPAQTLHRLLEYSPSQGFVRKREHPLEADLVIVDEVSMLDVPLAYRLTSALRPGTGLVLVGDVDQLPSVGVGTVLRDLIESGTVAVVRLTVVFRQAAESAIVVNAHRVNRGEPPLAGQPAHERERPSDFYVVRAEEPERALELLAQVVCERIPRTFGLDPLRDVQVLSPMYRGVLGCDSVNARLRALLCPGGADAPGLRGLRLGDKVMQVRNDYETEVFNGDVGRVVAARPDRLTVEIDGRSVDYDASKAEDLQLAYCITVHKSQGSEYPAVVVALHGQHHIMLARNLLYTAITRGKRLVVLVGSPAAMARAAATDRQVQRHGRLRERLLAALDRA